jgi:hypothetical protein
MNKPTPFIDYWNEVDQKMQELYAIDTLDAGIEPEEIADAQDEGWTADEFVGWFAQERDLNNREDWNQSSPKAKAILQMVKSIADQNKPA